MHVQERNATFRSRQHGSGVGDVPCDGCGGRRGAAWLPAAGRGGARGQVARSASHGIYADRRHDRRPRSSSASLPALWKPYAHLPTTRYHEDGVPFWSPMLSPRPAQTRNPRLHPSIHRRLSFPPTICDSKLQGSHNTMVRGSRGSCRRRDPQSTCLR